MADDNADTRQLQQQQQQLSDHQLNRQDTLDSSPDANAVQIRPVPDFANLPELVLEKIFKKVPAEYRSVVAAVCPPWRSVYLGTSSCQRGTRLGRISNLYLARPPSLSRADFPLTHVEEITFTPAIPAIMKRSFVQPNADDWRSLGSWVTVAHQLKEIPNDWLGVVLQRAAKIRRLDLSGMIVYRRNTVAFRYK